VLNNCPGNLKMLASTSERKNNNPIKILLEWIIQLNTLSF
jgi:hypothetical protein